MKLLLRIMATSCMCTVPVFSMETGWGDIPKGAVCDFELPKVKTFDTTEARDQFLRAEDSSSWTPLMKAADAGNLDEVVALIGKSDTDINACSTLGETVLSLAIQKGSLSCVDMLIRRGASLRLPDIWYTSRGYNLYPHSLLGYAARHKNIPLVALLLSYGVLQLHYESERWSNRIFGYAQNLCGINIEEMDRSILIKKKPGNVVN